MWEKMDDTKGLKEMANDQTELDRLDIDPTLPEEKRIREVTGPPLQVVV